MSDLQRLAALPAVVDSLMEKVRQLETRLNQTAAQGLTVEQAAKLRGVHPATIRRLCKEGHLKHTRTGRRITVYL